MNIKNDLNLLSLDHIYFESKTHELFISSWIDTSIFEKKVIGFCWNFDGEKFLYTKRVGYEANKYELALISFYYFLELLDKKLKSIDSIEIKVYFKDFYEVNQLDKNEKSWVQNLITEINSLSEMLNRKGIIFSFDDAESSDLEPFGKLTLKRNKEFNDFINQTTILSAVSSKNMDSKLNDLYPMIQYLSEYEKGINNTHKKIFFPDDLIWVNKILDDLNIINDKFPYSSPRRMDFIRRLAATIDDSELSLIFTSSDSSIEDLPSPDIWFLRLSEYFDKEILIHDGKDNKWYKKSITERRDFVKARGINFSSYKRIALFSNKKITETSWKAFRKVIRRN